MFFSVLLTAFAVTVPTSAAPTVDGDGPSSLDYNYPQFNSPGLLLPLKQHKNNIDIYSLVIHSKIKFRYAQTVVSTYVVNRDNISNEIQFLVTLPESAFISKFLIEINGTIFKSYVKEKEEAKKEYITAVNSGQSAAHVELNARNANIFKVSVNVEAESKVKFNLTYEQLLTRRLETYEHIINVQPGQVVKNLQVIVDIEEPSNITMLQVLDKKTIDKIPFTTKNKLANIYYESEKKVKITWSPTENDQVLFTKRGINGQIVVQYDVDHKNSPNQILIHDGYFVHYFAPTNLKPLRTHIIFVLDVSSSMSGLKLSQLKDAIGQILSEIRSEDFFSIIIFSTYAQIWPTNPIQETLTNENCLINISKGLSWEAWAECVFPATTQNIQKAKQFVQDLEPEGSTNIEDAFVKALNTAETGKMMFENHTNVPKPIIMFLTDGEATSGITDSWELIKYISDFNLEKFPIFSLGFGDKADNEFLKRLSLNNSGFSRVIYEASDASLQLRNFYKEISSPVLSNVSFKYVDAQVDTETVTTTTFDYFFRGTELVVAGKVKDTETKFNTTLNANSLEGIFNDSTYTDIPMYLPATKVQQTRHIGYLEKLWAYLYIQQLIDQYELNKQEGSNEKKKALELALKYSFVTPFTSLVVVKPNNTETATNMEKNILTVEDLYKGHSLLLSDTDRVGLEWDEVDFESEQQNKTTLPLEISVGYEYINTSWSPFSITKLTWLQFVTGVQPYITLRETLSAYRDYPVMLNTHNQSYQNCTTPDLAQGKCKHLKDCIVPSILNSIEAYLHLFCPIQNAYAGICCVDEYSHNITEIVFVE